MAVDIKKKRWEDMTPAQKAAHKAARKSSAWENMSNEQKKQFRSLSKGQRDAIVAAAKRRASSSGGLRKGVPDIGDALGAAKKGASAYKNKAGKHYNLPSAGGAAKRSAKSWGKVGDALKGRENTIKALNPYTRAVQVGKAAVSKAPRNLAGPGYNVSVGARPGIIRAEKKNKKKDEELQAAARRRANRRYGA